MKHPRDLGPKAVEDFLKYLVMEREVAASTQAQALNALVFLFGQVLGQEKEEYTFRRAKPGRRLPEVLTTSEVKEVLVFMHALSAIIVVDGRLRPAPHSRLPCRERAGLSRTLRSPPEPCLRSRDEKHRRPLDRGGGGARRLHPPG